MRSSWHLCRGTEPLQATRAQMVGSDCHASNFYS